MTRHRSTLGTDTGVALFPFPGALLRALECVSRMSVPVRYMISPPTVPERGGLVREDERRVKRPREGWDGGGGGGEMWWLGMGVWEVFVIWRCVFG